MWKSPAGCGMPGGTWFSSWIPEFFERIIFRGRRALQPRDDHEECMVGADEIAEQIGGVTFS